MLWRVEDIKSGRPCIAGTGVMVETLAGRFSAGDRIEDLAADYNIPAASVEAAIRLVVASAFTKFGLFAEVQRRMAASVPLTVRPAHVQEEA